MPDTGNRGASENGSKNAAGLYWLVFLLTCQGDLSVDIAAGAATTEGDSNQFFGSWMRDWAKKVAIAKAVAGIHEELAESLHRTMAAKMRPPGQVASNWRLPEGTTKAELERALLAIDVFPRAALLLTTFEGVHTADAATLLDADVALIRKAQAIGLRELTANLAYNHTNHPVAGFSIASAFA